MGYFQFLALCSERLCQLSLIEQLTFKKRYPLFWNLLVLLIFFFSAIVLLLNFFQGITDNIDVILKFFIFKFQSINNMLIFIFKADFIMFKSGDSFCKLKFAFLKFLNINIELAYFIAVLFDFFLVEFYGWI